MEKLQESIKEFLKVLEELLQHTKSVEIDLDFYNEVFEDFQK